MYGSSAAVKICDNSGYCVIASVRIASLSFRLLVASSALIVLMAFCIVRSLVAVRDH